jgi:hypothetical protein
MRFRHFDDLSTIVSKVQMIRTPNDMTRTTVGGVLKDG